MRKPIKLMLAGLLLLVVATIPTTCGSESECTSCCECIWICSYNNRYGSSTISELTDTCLDCAKECSYAAHNAACAGTNTVQVASACTKK